MDTLKQAFICLYQQWKKILIVSTSMVSIIWCSYFIEEIQPFLVSITLIFSQQLINLLFQNNFQKIQFSKIKEQFFVLFFASIFFAPSVMLFGLSSGIINDKTFTITDRLVPFLVQVLCCYSFLMLNNGLSLYFQKRHSFFESFDLVFLASLRKISFHLKIVGVLVTLLLFSEITQGYGLLIALPIILVLIFQTFKSLDGIGAFAPKNSSNLLP